MESRDIGELVKDQKNSECKAAVEEEPVHEESKAPAQQPAIALDIAQKSIQPQQDGIE